MLSAHRLPAIVAGISFVVGALTSAGAAALVRRPPAPPPSEEPAPIVRPNPLPADQAELCARVAVRAREYRAARGNDLRRSSVRHARDADLLALERNVADWTGVITTLSTNGDGNAYLSVKLTCAGADVTLHTWTMAIVDAADQTLIPPSSPLFTTLSSLKEGDYVRFAGVFVALDDHGALRETSLTERGGMRAPELVFRFTDITAMP